ncbi:MAG: cytochrome c [Planctomycetes bacterium]|nr:cytochrome c [Planctomycetota bacterium]
MKNVRWGSLVMLVCAVAGLALLSTDANAQKTKGKTRAALTKQLMKGLVASNCGALKKDLDAEAPNWEDVALHAALLNESGHILLDDGRCPDGDWAGASKALQTQSAAILEAAEKKDAAAAKEAFGKLTAEACGACHKAHKK